MYTPHDVLVLLGAGGNNLVWSSTAYSGRGGAYHLERNASINVYTSYADPRSIAFSVRCLVL